MFGGIVLKILRIISYFLQTTVHFIIMVVHIVLKDISVKMSHYQLSIPKSQISGIKFEMVICFQVISHLFIPERSGGSVRRIKTTIGNLPLHIELNTNHNVPIADIH